MIAGVDIGGTKIAVGLVNDEGKVFRRVFFGCHRRFQNAMKRVVEALRAATVSSGTEISGIGIGCTGPIDPFDGVIGDVNFLPGWQGENPVHELQQIFKVSVAMENDADAAAVGEAGWGAGKGKRSLIYVSIGTGIGGGIIFDGHLYRGVDQAHPEIGHHVLDSSGPLYFCGARGCWEVLARGPAMVDWMQSKAPKNYPDLAELTGKRICELAEQGEAWARLAVEREASYLGLGLANLVTLFAPQAIVLGGSVMKNASLFLDGITKTIRQNCGLVPFEKTKLTLASLGADTALIGAARVWHYRFTHVGG